MPTNGARHCGPKRGFVWRCIQVGCGVLFRTWVRLRVDGLEHIDKDRPGLLIANHQSYLDPLLVAVMMERPVSYVARDSLFRIPLIGWVLRKTYVTPISRSAARASTIRAAVERVEQGFLVGVFPEGTRSVGEVKEFQPGMSSIVRRTNAPIYPVGIAGADRVLPKGALFLRPRRIHLVVRPAISSDELESVGGSRSELVELVRADVVRAQCSAQCRLEGKGEEDHGKTDS